MNIKRVKIYGAGSIGNHLANASREIGAEVSVVDVSQSALERMKNEIYPARYGSWDEQISLFTPDQQPRGGFDLVCIGTPPAHHLPLGIEALKEKPKCIQVEKPLCAPSLVSAAEFAQGAKEANVKVFVGYDHVVGKAAQKLVELLASETVGQIKTFDVEFREHWGGIFKAHPWLTGPEDSYLGFWKDGGGASGEHSHALNFWQYLSHISGFGKVTEVSSSVTYVRQGKAYYDDLCAFHLKTETGMVGRVIQDVIAQPSKKWAVLHGTEGTLEWYNGYTPTSDAVILKKKEGPPNLYEFPKRRRDDFIEELKHIDKYLGDGPFDSPISLERGLETMLVIAAAHQSEAEKRRISIDYKAGWNLSALKKLN